MSTISIKKINALPEVASLRIGDMFAMDRGDAAYRVDATKIGPTARPMSGDHSPLVSDGLQHPWLHSLFWHETSKQSFMIVEHGARHVQSYGNPLVLYRSIDHFNTSEEAKSIFSKTGEDITQAIGGGMDAGRIGAFLSTRDAADAYKHYFIYSDDDGDTFTELATVIPDADKFFGYGELIHMPKAATGLGSDGYAVFGYGTGGVQISHTVDNGATWANSVVVANGTGSTTTPLEPFVVRLGDVNKWVMFIRENGANMSMSTSTNLLTWSTPVDTGILLGGHPVSAIYDAGNLYVYMASRNASPRLGDRNTMYMAVEDADSLWAAGNMSATPIAAFTAKSQLLGYVQAYAREGVHYYAYVAGETEQGADFASTSAVFFGSTIPRGAPAVIGGSPNRNLLDNPYFSDWRRGDTVVVSGVTKVASRWVCSPSGATGTVSRAFPSDATSLITPWNGHFCMGIDLSSNDFGRFYQVLASDPDVEDGEATIRRMSDQIFTVQVWGYGYAPPNLYARLEFDYGTGGSADVIQSVTLAAHTVAGGMWMGTATVRGPAHADATVGTSPKVTFAIGHSGTGAWVGKLLGVKLEYGDTATQMEPEDPHETNARISRYLRTPEYGPYDIIGTGIQRTSGRCEIFLPTDGMFAAPVASFTGAMSDLELNSTNGTKTPTSVTFEGPSRNGVLMVASEATLTAGSARLRQVNAGSFILLDAEPT